MRVAAHVLRVRSGDGDTRELLAPSVGIFTPNVAVGDLVASGQSIGTIDVLGVQRALVVPAGTSGRVSRRLGGGRTRADDPIDYSVGLTDLAPVGRDVGGDMPLAVIHAKDEASFDQAAEMIRKAYTVGGDAAATSIVMERID